MIYAFNSPMVGPGQLLPREDAHAGTDKERFLFEPNSSDKFWKPLAAQLAATGTSVYLNLAQRCDLATLGQIVTMTGGTTRLYPQFTPEKDSVVMETDLASSLDRVFGYDALMRIRCSNGLRVGKYYGNFIINEHDVELAGLDSRTTLSASIAYDGALDEKYDSSFQLAMLYTTATGSRRIRVLTYAVPASSVIGNVFRGGDIDATVNHVLRVSADQVSQVGNKTYRDHLADVCVKLLASYRKNCASGTAAGQLILPEAYKLLPLYSLSMSRLRPFRCDYGIDARVALLERLKSAPVYETLAMVYPRMWCVSELVDGEWILDEVRASIERLDHSKAYLMGTFAGLPRGVAYYFRKWTLFDALGWQRSGSRLYSCHFWRSNGPSECECKAAPSLGQCHVANASQLHIAPRKALQHQVLASGSETGHGPIHGGGVCKLLGGGQEHGAALRVVRRLFD